MNPIWRTPFAELHAPAGMILPIQVGDYNIPVTNSTGAVVKALDIRPPAQPLALVSGRGPSLPAIRRLCWLKARAEAICGHRW